jgi:hypothetical protein
LSEKTGRILARSIGRYFCGEPKPRRRGAPRVAAGLVPGVAADLRWTGRADLGDAHRDRRPATLGRRAAVPCANYCTLLPGPGLNSYLAGSQRHARRTHRQRMIVLPGFFAILGLSIITPAGRHHHRHGLRPSHPRSSSSPGSKAHAVQPCSSLAVLSFVALAVVAYRSRSSPRRQAHRVPWADSVRARQRPKPPRATAPPTTSQRR